MCLLTKKTVHVIIQVYQIERRVRMRYFLIDTDDGKNLGNVIVKANTIEEALRIARNENKTLNEER